MAALFYGGQAVCKKTIQRDDEKEGKKEFTSRLFFKSAVQAAGGMCGGDASAILECIQTSFTHVQPHKAMRSVVRELGYSAHSFIEEKQAIYCRGDLASVSDAFAYLQSLNSKCCALFFIRSWVLYISLFAAKKKSMKPSVAGACWSLLIRLAQIDIHLEISAGYDLADESSTQRLRRRSI